MLLQDIPSLSMRMKLVDRVEGTSCFEFADKIDTNRVTVMSFSVTLSSITLITKQSRGWVMGLTVTELDSTV